MTGHPAEARAAQVGHRPGLDGLRALAVAAVIIYHLKPGWLPGGFIGVDVFFVLSGYLITSLLLAEWTRIGQVHLRAFWVRRARRLLPAVVALLIVVLIAGVLVARDAVPRLRGDIPSSLGYIMNWRLIFHKDSYLQTFGRPPLLLHLWSLAIEEQFYLVWPPVVALVLWRGRNRKHLTRVALAGAVASSAAMALAFHPGGNPAAVYFGTGTHAEGLLIGCALAAAIPPWRAGISLTQRGRKVMDGAGFGALAGVIALAATMTQAGTFTYRGGLVLADVATAVAVVAAVRSGSWVSRALSPAPFIWAGTRSYSLYLWHWPVYALTQPRTDVPMTGWGLLGFRLALIGLAAELSYRFVEQPWRTGRAEAALRAAWAARAHRLPWAGTGLVGVGGLAAALVLVNPPPASGPLAAGATPSALASIGPPPTSLSAPASRLVSVAGSAASSPSSASGPHASDPHASDPHASVPPASGPPPSSPPGGTVGPTSTGPPPVPTGPPPTSTAPKPQTLLASREPILAIGDSVLLAASPALRAQFGASITVDAAVGRQVAVGLQRLAEYRAGGELASYATVLIDLGTNGPFMPDQFARFVQLTAGVKQVVFCNVYVPRSWQKTTDATVTAGVAAHPGMRLLDWYRVAPRPGLLYPDGVHPSPAGAQVFSQLLAQTLSQ